MTPAREALASAIIAKQSAATGYARAQQTLSKADDYLDQIERELRDVDASLAVAAAEHADSLKAALASGAPIPALPAASDPATRRDIETRRAVAARARAELATECQRSVDELRRAEDEVESCRFAVVAEEARHLADEITSHEAKALDLRARLSGVATVRGRGRFDPETEAVLIASNSTDVGTRNTPLWREATALAPAWKAFAEIIGRDASAQIEFVA